jgi:hypothetical protein
LKPDVNTSQKILSYFEKNTRYKHNIRNPKSIKGDKIIELNIKAFEEGRKISAAQQ